MATLYFVANDGSGNKIWRSVDGAPAELVPGAPLDAVLVTSINGALYFATGDLLAGFTIQRITTAGVIEPVPGAPTALPGSSQSFDFAGLHYFTVRDPANTGDDLWRINAAGNAELFSSLPPGVSSINYTPFNGELYFTSSIGGQVYHLDAAGTAQPLGGASAGVHRMAVAGGDLYFDTGSGISRLTGTGTVETIPGAPTGFNTAFVDRGFVAFDNTVYFTASSPATGIELWRVNAAGNIELVRDFTQNADNGLIANSNFTAFNGSLWFDAPGSASSVPSLWRVLPGGGVPQEFKTNFEILSGQLETGSEQINEKPVVFNGALYFSARVGTDIELWRITAANVVEQVADINPVGASNPHNLTVSGGFLFFTATNGGSGFELFRTDGAITELVSDIVPGPGGSIPGNLIGDPTGIHAATITGVATAALVEDGATLLAGGLLTVHDPDPGESVFRPLADPNTLFGAYGDFTFDAASGIWGYTLANAAANVQALRGGEVVHDTLTVTSSDGSATQVIDVAITGANDPAIITIVDTATGAVVEDGQLTATGTLAVTDPDTGEAVFQAPASLAGSYGTFAFNTTSGRWDYTLANAAANVQALAGGQVVHDTLTVKSLDGTASQLIDVTVTGTNDVATIAGTATGAVVEDGQLTASGTLTATDPDTAQSVFQIPANLTGTYGIYSFNAGSGVWTYTLNNAAANVQALNSGQTVHDTLTVTSLDGTAAQTIDVTITGADEPAAAASVTVPGVPVIGAPGVNIFNIALPPSALTTTVTAAPGNTVYNILNGNLFGLNIVEQPGAAGGLLDALNIAGTLNNIASGGIVALGATLPANIELFSVASNLSNLTLADTAGVANTWTFNQTTTLADLARIGSIDAGVGNDDLILNFAWPGDPVVPANPVTVSLGAGNDKLLLDFAFPIDPVFPSDPVRILIDGGAGNDAITVTLDTLAVTVLGGPGADAITLLNGNTPTSVAAPLAATPLVATLAPLASLAAPAAGAPAFPPTIPGGEVHGGDGNDVITGSGRADILSGDAGFDLINAGGGNDRVVATVGDGFDFYNGGAGIDTYDLSGTSAGARVNLAEGFSTSAQTGFDALLNFENVIGSAGNDRIEGNKLANILTGGAGDDHFVFRQNFGHDTITDFQAAGPAPGDVMELSRALGVSSFTQLLADHHLSEDAVTHDAMLTFGANTITLTGVHAASLAANDFLFI